MNIYFEFKTVSCLIKELIENKKKYLFKLNKII